MPVRVVYLLLRPAGVSEMICQETTKQLQASSKLYALDVAIMAANAKEQPAADRDPQHAFTRAAANGDMERLQELSGHPNVQINGRNGYGRTAVQVMTMTRPEIAEFLLSRGANPNEPDRDVGRTPLHDAAEHGHVETVQWLLRYGADPTMREMRGNTPAHLAAREGRSAEIFELLSRGATLWERNDAQHTPHEEATANGKHETAVWIANYHSSGEGLRLKHLCRLAIHRVIGPQRMSRTGDLNLLPLPGALLDYLKMHS